MRWRLLVSVVVVVLTGRAMVASPPPWQVWPDLSRLAVIDPGDQVVLRSSYCPDGCAFDRHAAGDSRFLYTDGKEGIIFEAEGPGAITRIWMTMGDGRSRPLDDSVRLRIRVDGERRPVVNLPLSRLFSGAEMPFLAPLVADRTVSSGGNVCYVPIPFRDGCRVSLVGAEETKLWFQITAHLLAEAGEVRSFTGKEDLTGWASLLARAGEDPWSGGPYPTVSGVRELAPGETLRLATLSGPDVVNGVLLRVDPKVWPETAVRLSFDGVTTVDLPLVDFFLVGQGRARPATALLVGGDGEDLYCYLPMPFQIAATIDLVRVRLRRAEPATVEYAVRRLGAPPLEGSGVFGASVLETPAEGETRAVMVDLEGRGKWVGVFVELGSTDASDLDFLESDEVVVVDGATVWHGTGAEDFIGGGFYFRVAQSRSTRFQLPLHGMLYSRRLDAVNRAMGMYRFFLSDAPVFSSGLRAYWEGGSTGTTILHQRAVSYYYLDPPRGIPTSYPELSATLCETEYRDLRGQADFDPERRLDNPGGTLAELWCSLDTAPGCDAGDLRAVLRRTEGPRDPVARHGCLSTDDLLRAIDELYCRGQ